MEPRFMRCSSVLWMRKVLGARSWKGRRHGDSGVIGEKGKLPLDLLKLCSSVTTSTRYPLLNPIDNLKTAEFAWENIMVLYMPSCHSHQPSISQSRISFSIITA
jgi:hypothetical protein